ncbi:MAG TPA: hypothetical protein VJN69_13450 [Candidatus Acidoferrales bacterium]|nr:hypothetical protein [Candidatus Acidoferrales bacterium]
MFCPPAIDIAAPEVKGAALRKNTHGQQAAPLRTDNIEYNGARTTGGRYKIQTNVETRPPRDARENRTQWWPREGKISRTPR